MKKDRTGEKKGRRGGEEDKMYRNFEKELVKLYKVMYSGYMKTIK